jgi:hypothetical protein
MFPIIRVDHGTFENNDISGNFILNSKTKIKAKQLAPVLLGTSKTPELFDIPEEENKYKAFIESKKELKKQYEQWVENEEKIG